MVNLLIITILETEENERFIKTILKEDGMIQYQQTEFIIRDEFDHIDWQL